MTKRFDEAAANWDEKPRRVELSRRIVEAIKEAVPFTREMTALEIGCGTGLLTLGLASELKSIMATDSSQGMIKVLRSKIESNEILNIETRCFDFVSNNNLSAQKRFDLIYSGMVFHHIQLRSGWVIVC